VTVGGVREARGAEGGREGSGNVQFKGDVGSNSQVAAAAGRTLDDSNKKFRNYEFRHAKILSSK
jgi:hypothetical protein